MTAPNGLPLTTMPDLLEQTEQALTERVHEALWQAQVQHMRSQEWFNFAADGFVLTDLEGVIQEANYAAAALLDARKEFLLGKPLGLFLTAEHQRVFYEHLTRLAKRDRVASWETCLGRSGSPPREVMLTATTVSGDDGRDLKLRWMLHDISRARQLERAWQAEKSLADCLLETAEIFILLVDDNGLIHRCNPYLRTVSGYEVRELNGHNWTFRLLPEKERHAGRRLLFDARMLGCGRSGVLDLATCRGSYRRVLWSARPCGGMVLLLGHDVTELEEAQRQALQAERLAAIGQMAAGLAHESRNALQRSQACVALLGLRLQDQPECLELLGRIEKAQDDLKRLFDDVRAASVAPRPQPAWYDLCLIWREAWSDLAGQPEWPTAELHEDLDDTELFCHVDRFYLKQVFRNLLENALSSGADPVRIVIQCRQALWDEKEAICLRLRDNGSGIPPEARARLFEPFFTTKVRGTGLGLAICQRIVEAHGGHIHVGETSESGTEMVLILPRRGT